jgi:AraC-like DNA-binding protein
MGISRQSLGTLIPAVDDSLDFPAHTALAAPAFAYVEFGIRHGLSRESLLTASGLDESLRADPDARCSISVYMILWRELLTRLPDVVVPVALAQSLDDSVLGVIAQIIPRADNLQHASELLDRYVRLTDTALGSRRIERGDLIGHQVVHRPEVIAMRYPVELMLAVAHRILGPAFSAPLAVEVTFAHPAGYPVAAYEALFGIPVRFDQPDSALWFSRAALTTPFASRDPIARRYLEAFAARSLDAVKVAELSPASSLRASIRDAILYELATSGADLARVAKRLAVSTRTLQRRLEEAGTSYQDLVDSSRAALAQSLLRDATLSITDIAFELGYADLKSFYRAFRRWKETTPAEWRRALQRSL